MKFVPAALVSGSLILGMLLVPTTDSATSPTTKMDIIHQLKKERREFDRRLAHMQVRVVLTAPTAHLARIAVCESGGNPRAVSPGGTYRGKYQFDMGTWRGVGGTGDPADAPEPEQDYRAWLLYQRRGAQPWPVCGRR